MKASLICVVLTLWVSAVLSSQGIPPPAKQAPTTSRPYYTAPTQSSYYQSQYTQNVKNTGGAQVSVHSKVTAPQTGPIVTFSQTTFGQENVATPTVNVHYQKETTYQRPVVHVNEQHFVTGSNVRVTEQKTQQGSYQYGGSVSTQHKYNQETVSVAQCRKPKRIPNFNFELTVTKGTWYFPLIHKVDLNNINEITYGYELRSTDNINNLCLRNEWTAQETFVKFSGRDDITSGEITCNSIENGAGTECFVGEKSRNPVKMYGVKSDNKNYLLVTSCWSSGESGWTLFSLTPKISYSLKQEIYAEVRALGFDVADALEVSYDSCQGQSFVKTVTQTNYETKIKETTSHFGQRPVSTVFTQHQVVQPGQQYVQKTTVYQPTVFQKEVVTTRYANCKVPADYKLASIRWRSENTDAFYFPLIHEHDLDNYYKIVFGRGLRSNENTNSQCLHNHWSVRNRGISSVSSSVNLANDLVYSIVGADRTSEPVNCQQIGNRWAYECTPVQGETFKVYTVKTDNEKYALAYTCWESGTTGWTLLSDTPTVSAIVKKDVLKQVETLGFGKNDIVFELNYDACNNILPGHSHQFVSGQNTVYGNKYVVQDKFASTVSKYGHCKEPSHYQLVDFKWNSEKDLYYYPLIHQNDYNNYYKILFGQDVTSDINIDSVCLNNRWSFLYPNTQVNNQVNIISLDRTSEPLSCKQIGTKFAYECVNELGNSYRLYVVKTDQRNWYLAYTCWESGTTGWTVYSTTPKVTYQTKQEVLRQVKTLGFDSDDYLEVNYDQCKGDGVQTTFTSTIKETKPAVFQQSQYTYAPGKQSQTTYTQQRESTTFVQKPVVHQTTTTFVQKPFVQQTTFTQRQPVVQLTTSTISKYGHCKEPSHYQLVDYKWNSKKDLYYYPLIHQNDYNNYYKILFGRDVPLDVEIDSVCLNNRWSFLYPNTQVNNQVNIISLDRISEPLSCKQIGTKFAYECVNEFGNSYRLYVVKTDQSNWYLAYTCWESGTTGWTVYSTTPKVTYQTKQEVLRQVKALGFDSDDYLEVNYDQCNRDGVQTTFTSTVKETKPAVIQQSQYTYTPGKQSQTTYTQQRETTTFVQKPVVQQTTFVQKPFVQQTTTFVQKPVVPQTTFTQRPFIQQTTFTQRQPVVVQQTTYNQKQTYGSYSSGSVQKQLVFSGIRSTKYQHCSIPPLNEIADSPLSSTVGIRNQADLTLQEQYFYFPLSQRRTLNSVNRFVFGKDLYSGEQVNNLCYGSKFSWTGRDKDILITFYSKGFNNRSSEEIVCRQEDSTKWLGECVTSTGETFLAYVVRDDVKEGEANGFIGNFCWDNGQSSWNFFSTEKTVSNEDKEIVLREVGRLGYDSADYVQISYAQCRKDTFEDVLQAEFFRKTIVKQTTFVQKPFVQQTTTFVQKPFVQQTTTFVQKPVVPQTTFTQRPFIQQTTFTQRQPVVQQTTYNQKQTYGSYNSGSVQKQLVFNGIRSTKYQHCSIPPLTEIADSPLSSTVGIRNQADLTLQEQYFYFPLSQRRTLNSVNRFVFGKDLYSGEQVNNLCYGSKFSWTGKDKDILITFYSKGFNNRSSEEIVCRQEDNTKWLGECVTSTGETFLAYVVRDDVKEGDASGFIGNFCWDNGQSSWNFFSTEKTVSSEDKEIVLREVGRLGYDSADYVQLSYTQCRKDTFEDVLQAEFFRKTKYVAIHHIHPHPTNNFQFNKVSQGPFQNCRVPKDYLRRYTFESSTFAEGVEYFDVVLMHEEEPEILNQLLNYKKYFNLRNEKDSACYRIRVDYSDNVSQKILGFRDVVSDSIQCTQHGNEHRFNCASKVTGDSYKSYGIKSDSSTWELSYKCWESGKETWAVRAKPGTILTESIKKNILNEVEKLGFNPTQYVEFNHDKCEFNSNLFSGYEGSCDCCKVKKIF